MGLFNNHSFDEPQQDVYAGSKGIYTPRGASLPQVGSKVVPATSTKTNVLTSASGTNSIMPVIDNKYTTFKTITSIVRLYEFYSLTEKVVELIKDYVIRTIDPDADIIATNSPENVPDNVVKRLNEIFTDIDFKKVLSGNYDKIIYHGSTAYAISEEVATSSTPKKYHLSKLRSPHDVVVVSNDKLRFYLVQRVDETDTPGGIKNTNTALGNMSSKATTELLTDDKILYLGPLDFELKHDQESKKVLSQHFKGTKKEETSTRESNFGVEAYKKDQIKNSLIDPEQPQNQAMNNGETDQKKPAQAFQLEDKVQEALFKSLIDHEFNLTASKPLYYSVHQKMKDYFIKDLLLYVLGVKSSVQPQILTWGVDSNYNYTVDELMDLVSNLESRMNKLVDIETLNSANMDMDVLVNRILGNLRILPDLGNNIRALEAKELDDITKRIDDLINRKANTKDEILDALGIPKDLFEGATNREEVIKRDERFQSMVFKFIDRIRNSVKIAACTFAKLEGFEVDPKYLDVPMFRKSGIEYVVSAARLESVRDLTGTMVSVLSDYQQLQQTSILDQAKLLEFMRKQFSNVGGDLGALLLETLPQQNPE